MGLTGGWSLTPARAPSLMEKVGLGMTGDGSRAASICLTERPHTGRPAPLEVSIIFRRATKSWGNEKRQKSDILLQFSFRSSDLRESGVKTESCLDSTLISWAQEGLTMVSTHSSRGLGATPRNHQKSEVFVLFTSILDPVLSFSSHSKLTRTLPGRNANLGPVRILVGQRGQSVTFYSSRFVIGFLSVISLPLKGACPELTQNVHSGTKLGMKNVSH